MTAPNFARLDGDRPEISRLMTAMLQAREALSRRSWSHPLEYTGEEWWEAVSDGYSCLPLRHWVEVVAYRFTSIYWVNTASGLTDYLARHDGQAAVAVLELDRAMLTVGAFPYPKGV
jgi:hypothetical protein